MADMVISLPVSKNKIAAMPMAMFNNSALSGVFVLG